MLFGLVCILYFSFFPEYRRQGGENASATFYLFLGFFEYAVYKFEVQFAHPCGATLGGVGQAAVEVEGCAYGYLHAVLEVWLQTLHELFLFWCAQGYPNDVRTILFYHLCNAGLVEAIDGAEG